MRVDARTLDQDDLELDCQVLRDHPVCLADVCNIWPDRELLVILDDALLPKEDAEFVVANLEEHWTWESILQYAASGSRYRNGHCDGHCMALVQCR